MRYAFGAFLIAHGLAHLVGFAAAWRLAPELPYHTTLFAGRIDIGDASTRMLGTFWIAAALGFAVAAAAVFRGAPGWQAYTAAAALFSLVLCIAEWPAARIGVAINSVLLVGLAARLVIR